MALSQFAILQKCFSYLIIKKNQAKNSKVVKLVPDELVTLTSWDARDFLILLVMVGWKKKGCCQGWSDGL